MSNSLPNVCQTSVNYAEKTSINLQLLEQSVNDTITITAKESQLSYNYTKLNLYK